MPDYTIVKFTAPWCKPCQAMAPGLKELAKHYPQISWLEYNADQRQDMADFFGVQSLPTLIFMQDEREVGRLVGAKPPVPVVINYLREVFHLN